MMTQNLTYLQNFSLFAALKRGNIPYCIIFKLQSWSPAYHNIFLSRWKIEKKINSIVDSKR